MKVISEISVISTLQNYQRFYRADPYSVHPRKVRSIEKVKEIAEENSYDVLPLLKLLETPPSSGRGGLPLSSDGEVKIVKPANLTDLFFVDLTNCERTTIDAYNSSEKGRLQDGDILVLSAAHAEGYIGTNTSIVHLNDNEKAICIGELIRLRPNIEKINPYYLILYLNSMIGKYMLNYSVRGQTVHLYPKDIEHLPVLLPPREIQDSIGNKLKQAIEAKIEAEKKRKEIKEIYAEILPDTERLIRYKKEISTIVRIQDAKRIGRVDPQYFSKWIKQIIENVQQIGCFFLEESKFLRGKTPSEKEYKNSGVFVVKVRNILQDGRIEIKGEKSYIDETDFDKNYKNFAIEYGDIIFVATGKGSIGRVGIFLHDLKAVCSGELLIYRESDEIKRWLILGLFLQPVMQEVLDKIALGPSGQTHLYPKQITKIPIPKFSEDKIRILVNNLKNYFSVIDESLQLHIQAMEELNKLLGLNSGGDNYE